MTIKVYDIGLQNIGISTSEFVMEAQFLFLIYRTCKYKVKTLLILMIISTDSYISKQINDLITMGGREGKAIVGGLSLIHI